MGDHDGLTMVVMAKANPPNAPPIMKVVDRPGLLKVINHTKPAAAIKIKAQISVLLTAPPMVIASVL